jgi:LysM repeat protein
MKMWWICLACLVVLMGCKPAPDSSQEDKEPNYLTGRRQVQQRDWVGAERSFHKSLEANPGSSLAHYELGVIYLSHIANPAAAIYHLDRYLTLNPRVANRNEVLGHIAAAKRDLARDIDGTPDAPSHSILKLRAELNRLAAENQALRHQLQSAGIPPNPQFGATTNAPVVINPPPKKGSAPSRPVASRTHQVKHGENPSSIARRYRLTVERLLGANPGLRPAKLQIGQVLKIPAQ